MMVAEFNVRKTACGHFAFSWETSSTNSIKKNYRLAGQKPFYRFKSDILVIEYWRCWNQKEVIYFVFVTMLKSYPVRLPPLLKCEERISDFFFSRIDLTYSYLSLIPEKQGVKKNCEILVSNRGRK